MKKKNCGLKYLLTILLTIISISVFAQTKTELESRRVALQKEINTTQSLLDQTGESKEAALSTLETLRKQISSRQALIENYSQQIRQTEKSILELQDSIGELELKLEEQTSAYFGTLRKMYLWKKQQPTWLYYFSSSSANEVFRKWVYLNQLEDWQEARKRKIQETREKLVDQKKRTEAENKRLATKRKELESTTEELNKGLTKEQRLLDQLKSKENELRRQLQQQVKERKELESAIARIIEESRKKASSEKKVDFAETPEGKAVSGAFESNKGKLPWPVRKGVVTRQFGKQKHPTLPNLYVQNNGVDIATEASAPVYALFKGEVLGVVEVPGYQQMIIVQHGAYFTVYSRLENVSVQKGDHIQTGSQIGQAYRDDKSGNTLVHLEIWKDKIKLDPVTWLAGR